MTLNDTKYQKNTDHFDKIGSHDWALKDTCKGGQA